MTAAERLSPVVERALNVYLRADPDAPGRLRPLEGKVVAVELKELGIVFYLCPLEGRIQVHPHSEREPDARIRGTPVALLRLGISRGTDRRLFSEEVEIRGDTELGQELKSVLDAVEIDWEEQLSRVIGDVPAHQMGNAARSVLRWGARAVDVLERDLGEYLREESDQLPNRDEVDAFLNAVDTLRSDLDRLEARIRRLEQDRATRGENNDQ